LARVLLFGRLGDIAGWRSRELEASSIAALRDILSEDDLLAQALAAPGVQVALDQAIVRGDAVLSRGSEVAFLPPMSGG
jgi:molybdopterin synthase sulfur carrier subunit